MMVKFFRFYKNSSPLSNYKQNLVNKKISSSSFCINLIILLCFFLTSCIFSNKETYNLRLENYKNEIKNYNCDQLKEEVNFVNQYLTSLDNQIKYSLIDGVMESVFSLGIFSFSGSYSLKQNKIFYEEKKKLIIINQKINLVYDKKN